ncbi:copper chaperone PCu(A)C [Rhodoferax sp. U11-2br]|uniref:copper chaperone PCu(A)C n=1 Tax=Rhodoferax sp. U11-2br TaxID=2838878 RepID=UPI001BE6AFAA|nr:copper chaperone PCu(A)C [Rhodoferax sp. U11-2br]MBT3067745.1 copper chaperone PCu(A)C [Rhodoferax sp. U11-2br]
MVSLLRLQGALSSLRPTGWRRWMVSLLLILPLWVSAHGVRKGELLMDHPYAVPSAPGAAQGQVYFRGIQNKGAQPDRLLGASTPQAARVVLERLIPEAHGLRTQAVSAINLPAKNTIRLRHTGDYQLTLLDLKSPLKDGDRFDVTLDFEHAGSQTVQVWVQTPRALSVSHAEH